VIAAGFSAHPCAPACPWRERCVLQSATYLLFPSILSSSDSSYSVLRRRILLAALSVIAEIIEFIKDAYGFKKKKATKSVLRRINPRMVPSIRAVGDRSFPGKRAILKW
jgi:hypothetical protein